MMFCPVCGSNMPDGARFCPSCGGTTEPPQMASQPTVSMPSYQATPMPTPGVGMDTQVMEIPMESMAGPAMMAPPAPEPKAKLSSRNKGLIAGLGAALAVILAVVAVVSFARPANAVDINENEFPDPVFRAYVSENLDANHDGKLSNDEIDSVTTIDISNVARDNARVSDLTGIGHFRGLHTLNASHCHLRHLPPDFNRLHSLRVCDLTYNQFNETINVTNNYNLIVIYVGGNEQGTTIEADENTNVITDPEKDMNNDEDILDYTGGENNESVDPDDLVMTLPYEEGENAHMVDDANSDQGGEATEGTATTGGEDQVDEGEGSDEATTPEGEGGEAATEDSAAVESGGAEAAAPAAAASDSDTLFAVQDGGTWGFVDQKGTAVLSGQFSEVVAYSEGIALVKDGSTYKFVKNNGEAANGVTSDYGALPYSGGFAYVATGQADPANDRGQSYPLVDGTQLNMPGKFVDAAGNDLAVSDSLIGGGEFHAGYAPARTSAGWGFINDQGAWVVQPGYEAVTSASNVNGAVVAGVCSQGTWTYVNVETGAPAFDGQFSEASAFDATGHAIAKHKAPEASTSEAAGDVALMPQATTARYMPGDAQVITVEDEFEEDYALEDPTEGFDGEDELFLDEGDEYYDAEAEAEAEAEAQRQAEEAAAQAAAEEAAAQAAAEEEAQRQAEEEAQRQAEEEAARELANKYVVIDGSGADVAVLEDTSTARPFYDGYAAVKNAEGKWGFVDANGSRVVECKFQDVGQFRESQQTHEKFAPAQTEEGKWGVIDTQGNFVVEAKYTVAKSAGAL